MQEKNAARPLPHGLILEGRAKLSLSGVTEVRAYDENGVVLCTGEGMLRLRGSGLRIGELNTSTGEMRVTGRIDSLVYSEGRAEGRGLWARLFT